MNLLPKTQRRHLTYSNVVSTLCLFLLLGGATAYAANTVFSADIVDGQVKTADLADGAATSAKLADGSIAGQKVKDDSIQSRDVLDNNLKGADIDESTLSNIGGGGPAGGDLTGSYPEPEIGFDAVGGDEVAPDSLSGGDIQESTLGEVPSAGTARLGGIGRTGAKGPFCDPESLAFVTCESATINLPAPARVLVIARAVALEEDTADRGAGECRLGTSVTGAIAGSSLPMFGGHEGGLGKFYPGGGTGDTATLVAVSPLVGPGLVSFGLDCNQFVGPVDGAIRYGAPQVSAVALSAG